MSVEHRYFDGCPTYKTTLKDLEEVVQQIGIHPEITLVKVKSEEDAKRLRFLGSPTVRVNGADVEPLARGSENYGFRCRIYRVNGKILGSSPKEELEQALEAK